VSRGIQEAGHGERSDPSRAIFINYRREDSGGQARALLYALERAFPGQVFMDVKGLAPGVNYLEEIEHTVGHCKVVLVLIGRGWVGVTDAAGRRRLKDPRDVVALEIGTALRRPDVLVIPVLVGGAALPAEGDLPESLTGLLSRQCLQLTEQDWDYNVSQLVETLRRKVGQAASGSRRRLWVGLAAAGILAVVGGVVALLGPRAGGPGAPTSPTAPPALTIPVAQPVAPAAPAAPGASTAQASPATVPPAAVTSPNPPPSKAPGRPQPGKAPPPSRAAALAKETRPPPAPMAKAEPPRADPAPPKPAEQRLAFVTTEVLTFNQYLGSPEARGHGRSLVGGSRWFLGPRDSLTFAPADQSPGFFPLTVRATRDGDRVSFEGVRTGRASDGQAYVRISGHMMLGKPPPALTVDLEFGRVSGADGTDLEPTFKAQARLQLRPE
jgi:hypothetical protein